MTEKNNGGPAFPAPEAARWHFADPSAYLGMTLRDYFAAKASEEDINEHIWKGHKEQFVVDEGMGKSRLASREAMWTREEAKYRYADAMLKARES